MLRKFLTRLIRRPTTNQFAVVDVSQSRSDTTPVQEFYKVAPPSVRKDQVVRVYRSRKGALSLNRATQSTSTREPQIRLQGQRNGTRLAEPSNVQ